MLTTGSFNSTNRSVTRQATRSTAMVERSVTRGVDGGRKQKSARDRVFAVAADLFYRKGVRAVGVEEIVREAGVAKISLYRGFASKDDLVAAYLDDRNAGFWRKWDEAFARHESKPRTQL